MNDPLHRADEVLTGLTLDEKIEMLHQHAPAVPRLGLPAFRTGSEVLHGVSWLGRATVFPQAVGLGASFNPDLLERVGAAVGDELRALHNGDPEVGLNAWGPVVNLLRDPRWGRNEEGYSEDPHLTAVLASAYCRGLRGGPAGPWKTAPTLKHFFAYNREEDKPAWSAGVRERTLWEYELRPFRETIERGAVAAVMVSYNKVNGHPNTLSPHLHKLRELDPGLVIVTDAWGLSGVMQDYRHYDDPATAYHAAVRAGIDNFTEQPATATGALHEALAAGLLRESDLDPAVRRMLAMRVRLGDLEPREKAPYRELTEATVASAAHSELALEAARQAVVLLKNDASTLPFVPAQTSTLAVIGQFAELGLLDWYSGEPPYHVSPLAGLRETYGASAVTFVSGCDRITLRRVAGGVLSVPADGTPLRETGAPAGPGESFDVADWGAGVVSLRCAANSLFLSMRKDGSVFADKPTPEGWRTRETFQLVPVGGGHLLRNVNNDRYAVVGPDGVVSMSAPDQAAATTFEIEVLVRGTEAAATAAAAADAAVVLAGGHPRVTACEGHDRHEYPLGQAQQGVVAAVAAANPRSAVVIVSGFPLPLAEPAAAVPALIWTCHSGQDLGRALAEVVSGAYSPAGRLPQSWPGPHDDLGDIDDYDIIAAKRTYLYAETEPLFPFGHGLGYARFDYGPTRISAPRAAPSDVLTATVTVRNDGAMPADEVVQLYVRTPGAHVPRPLRELRGFRRLRLDPGETAEVSFPIDVSTLWYWDAGTGVPRVEAGEHLVMFGRSSADIGATTTFHVVSDPPPPRVLGPALVRAAAFDDYSGMRLVAETRAAGEAVRSDEPGSWLAYRNVRVLPSGGTFAARVAARTETRIELRLDDPVHGPVLAKALVPAGAAHRWQTITCPVEGAEGDRDVYLVFDGACEIASFAWTCSTG